MSRKLDVQDDKSVCTVHQILYGVEVIKKPSLVRKQLRLRSVSSLSAAKNLIICIKIQIFA